ncbi:hypothetical protein PMIT1303_00677 [Prochlorococcus sp. MIT 1303]|nr:hypothetical protein PMIT1303_00677 [Prochlorococcus sp. MIT 1303]
MRAKQSHEGIYSQAIAPKRCNLGALLLLTKHSAPQESELGFIKQKGGIRFTVKT